MDCGGRVIEDVKFPKERRTIFTDFYGMGWDVVYEVFNGKGIRLKTVHYLGNGNVGEYGYYIPRKSLSGKFKSEVERFCLAIAFKRQLVSVK
jgi:hypothetical protein